MRSGMSMAFKDLIQDVLAMGDFVRYVAIGEGQRITTAERGGLEHASTSDSDRFEELFVNPALVTLARQRGELDCGGLRYIVVAYGAFIQLVMPTRSGHVSIAVEHGTELTAVVATVRGLLRAHAASPQEIR
jgi:hypothetical protein